MAWLQRMCSAPSPRWTSKGQRDRGEAGAGSLDILADLPLQPLPPLLQLLDGAGLWELIRGAAELTLSQGAAEQLLVPRRE